MMQLPSVQIDAIVEDRNGATQATLESSARAPFELADDMMLTVTLSTGSATVTLDAVEFFDITSATLDEVIAAIRPVVLSLGGEVMRTDESFSIRDSRYGAASHVAASGTASAALGLAGTVTGVDGEDEILIANRNPQPGEVQVPLSAIVEFDVIRTDGSSPADTFEVAVDGIAAWNGSATGGSFQHGFYGTVSSPDGASIRFVIQGALFESGQTVPVALKIGGSPVATWSFVTFDINPPLISSVVALNKDQIRVEFNEAVAMEDAAASNDALNADNYLIERISRPAATPLVARVERISDRAVLVTTSFELTFGAQYMLIVSDVTDEYGNAFAAPDNAAEFEGWLPPFPSGRRFLLHNFVPAAALAADETDDLRLFLGCLQDTVNLLLHMVDKWAEIIDPDVASEPFLDAMLADLENPFAFELTIEAKRRLAKLLVRIYQLVGTVPGIVDTIRFFLGIEVQVEIFNGFGWRLGYDRLSDSGTIAKPNPIKVGAGGRARYSFRIVTTEVLTPNQREQILRIANFMKGAGEHVVGIRDGTPKPLSYRYWKLGYTKVGYARLAGA